MKQTVEGFKSKLDVVEKTANGIEMREEEYTEKWRQRDEKGSLEMKEY